jgi:hypothetical protein
VEQFLAERYVAQTDVAREAARLRELASNADARLLQTVYLPDDELCFFIFESDSRERIVQLSRFDRVSTAVTQ